MKQLIEKQMELYEEFKLKRYHKKSIWKFYSALNLSLSFMKKNLSEDDIRKRNLLFRKILLSKNISKNKFRHIENMINSDKHYIIECLEILDNVQNEKYQMGDIYVPGMIGVSSYEFQV